MLVGLGRYECCGHRGSPVGICFPLTLFLSFSPYMALKVFEGGFSSIPREGAEASEPIARGRQEKDPRSLPTGRGTQQLSQ